MNPEQRHWMTLFTGSGLAEAEAEYYVTEYPRHEWQNILTWAREDQTSLEAMDDVEADAWA